MPHYTYLIIGGGMTADAAVHGIRQRDAHGAVGLISAELDAPYNRPPLCRSSILISLTSATKQSVTSMRGSTPSLIGESPTGKESSTIFRPDGCAVCYYGMSGGKSRQIES
jgi:hypothetical protein